MIIVEHMPLVPRWAEKISVEQKGETLIVSGVNRISVLGGRDERGSESNDLISEYRRARRSIVGEKRAGNRLPYLQFANAVSDESLVAFVRSYGPVWGHLPTWRPSKTQKHRDDGIGVEESLAALRRERWLFSRMVRLYALMADQSPNTDSKAELLGDLVRGPALPRPQWETDSEDAPLWYGYTFRANLSSYLTRETGWEGGETLDVRLLKASPEEIQNYANDALCLFINEPEWSRIVLLPYEGRFAETVRHERRGILPQLHFMFRQEILREQGVRMCALGECGKLFPLERYGQRFCSDTCSRLQRQRDYYWRRGKKLRRKRSAETRGTLRKRR